MPESKSPRRLDPKQKTAATTDAEIQLVLAGPGSGKTSTLTGRFVHLIRQGVDPRRILAVTFTKKAADEMRDRLTKLLNLPSARALSVMTFHAFAFRWLRQHPATFGLPEPFVLWEAPQQRRVFAAKKMWWNEEPDILDIISGAKERLLDADAFEDAIDDEDDVMLEAVPYFRIYEAAQAEAGAIDFADMVPLVVRAMDDNPDLKRQLTGKYDHILVDEYQDVNPGQIALIEHFVSQDVKLWAVGDDDQTLYSFRASDVRYTLDFTKRHPQAEMHVLDRNYRSTKNIVAAAKRLIRHNQGRIDKDYRAVLEEEGTLIIRGYSSPAIEARQVARTIEALIEAEEDPETIAVLYRTHAVGLPMQLALQEAKIPFELRGGADVWQSVAARLVTGALAYLMDGKTTEALRRLGTGRRSEIVKEELDLVKGVVKKDFTRACQHVQRIVRDAVPSRAAERDRAEWRTVVDAVIGQAQSSASMKALQTQIKDPSNAHGPAGNAVVLSTIHSAKGLEWDTVFLIGMEEGVLPHANALDDEEERRVAYVGLTRAKKHVGLTYAGERYGHDAEPSSFLFELTEKAPKGSIVWTRPDRKNADEQLSL